EPRLRLPRGLHDDADPGGARDPPALHAGRRPRADLRVVSARGPRPPRRRLLGGGRAPAVTRPLVLVYHGDPKYAELVRVETYREAQRQRRWLDHVLPDRLLGKTLVIVGLGDIGRAVARAARVLGMRVVGVSRSGRLVREADRVYKVGQLALALREGDFVVILVPLTPETTGLIGVD